MRAANVGLAGLLILATHVANAAPHERVLYNFQGAADGAFPDALTAGPGGILYGTSAGWQSGNGAIFALSPLLLGAWAETTLYEFKGLADGAGGDGGLLLDAHGNLFGVTAYGGPKAAGTVFELSPPAGGTGAWTETILYEFRSNHIDGLHPGGGLIADASGALYGVTYVGGTGPKPCFDGCGTVYRLSPPHGTHAGWSETVLYQFQNGPDGGGPIGPLVLDAAGNLYGTATQGGGSRAGCDYGCGTFWRLAPPASGNGAWSFATLHTFTPQDGISPQGALLPDQQGGFYGTAPFDGPFGHGTTFQLTPPSGNSTEWPLHILHAFRENNDGVTPQFGLNADAPGNLYGTAAFGGRDSQGVVYKLSPPGGGTGAWHETVMHAFRYRGDGRGPTAPVVLGAGGVLFGTTYQGGRSNLGTVFEIAP